jgi:hypothetical protein
MIRIFASCAIALLVCAGAWGQATTSLRGTITDKTGGSVAEAAVTLTNIDTGATRTMTTGSTGEYEFVQLPPGKYRLAVEKQGFRRYENRGLELLVRTPATVNVTLEVGSVNETVFVTTEAPALNTSDASLGTALTRNQVRQLPLEGLNVPDLLSLQAGVAYTGNRPDMNRDMDTRSGAVNGAHSDQSNITLDGVDVNDQSRGYAFTSVLPVTVESLQEFRVTTTNYNADQGRSSGAQLALVTRGGTNGFHGSLYESHRNTITSANDYFVKQSELSSGQPNTPPKLIRNIFGGSLGGPFWKDRLFFFVNYEGRRQREENSVLRIVPSDTLRAGTIQYKDVNGGITSLTAAQITSIDPLGLGPNPVMLAYFKSFPEPNDLSVSDKLNFVGFRFRGPVATNDDWYIARADFNITRNGSHTLFWRGALRNDAQGGVPYLPGGPSEQTLVDYSKGFVVGYTAALRSNLTNTFRWGYTRQSVGNKGNNDAAPVIFFRGINDNSTSNNSSLAVTRSRTFQLPVHNFVDDVSWTRGHHTLQFGTNIAFLRNPRNSFANSFSEGITNASWLPKAGIANTGTLMDPVLSGFPAVDPSFNNSYDYPLIALLGAVTQVNANYNYNRDGSVFPQGAPLTRRFASDSYEFYAQDSWKIKSNLTFTFGLRYSLFSPPWETNGLEVTPTMSLGDWFSLRGQHMLQGMGSFADPPVTFDLAGPANGKPSFYNWDYHNFGPRIAVAWSPNASAGLLKSLFGGPGKTSIRAGFGLVYDRIGQGLLTTFDRRGSFGMSTSLTNLAAVETLATAPRLTSLTTIPTKDFAPAPPGVFPQTFPNENQAGGFAATWGLDSSIKTPYSYTIDFSVGREVARNFSIEVSYVGRLSHRLLALEDLAQPVNLVDPKTKIDYYTAVKALATVYRTGINSQNVTPAMIGPAAVYWQNIIQPVQPATVVVGGVPTVIPGAYTIGSCTGGVSMGTTSPLQAAYDFFCGNSLNETTALQFLDQFGIPDFSNGNVYYGSCGITDPNATIHNCFMNPQ